MAARAENGVIRGLRFASSNLRRTPAIYRSPRAAAQDRKNFLEELRATIEAEIIPRLVLSHLPPAEEVVDHSVSDRCLDAAASELADCVLDDERGAARAVVDRLMERGARLEAVLLRVLGDAARLLGARWESDEADFLEVTLGMGMLHGLLHEVSQAYPQDSGTLLLDRRILLVATPGESHGFGVAMVSEIFRRRGWYVNGEPALDVEDVVQRVSGEWFHVVGLSLSSENHLGRLAECVRRIRAASRNKRVGIMVGGPIFQLYPEWLSRVGADASSHDAVHAVEQAETLIGLLVKAVADQR